MRNEGQEAWEEPAEAAMKAVLRGDAAGVRKVWRKLISAFSEQTLLYVALARSGQPKDIVASRGLQAVLRRLLAYLPRLGLLQETMQLITTIQEMEANHPVGPGAITEFDQMFKIGCRAIVRSPGGGERGLDRTGGEPGNDSELIAIPGADRPKPCSAPGWCTAAACGSRCWRPSTTAVLGPS